MMTDSRGMASLSVASVSPICSGVYREMIQGIPELRISSKFSLWIIIFPSLKFIYDGGRNGGDSSGVDRSTDSELF
ncbi:unnamed protein product [Microthlaspi erraticum]|uniref:Uncharacterized protein n=1 Tax=Microthlaspi erraticum TaxID=1685480 RepID=A0A6D2LKY9_9BRAS|nr:unnamed protein product [Microthlaspi erraticum]